MFRLLSAEYLTLFLLLIACIIIFAYAVHMVFIRKTSSFDQMVFTYLEGHVGPFLTDTMVILSFLGKHTFLIPANLLLLGFYLLVRKDNRLSLRISALALSSLTLMFLLKYYFKRPRPDDALLEQVSGFSFPSGHALISVTFYGLLIYICWKEITQPWLRNIFTVILVALILFIGVSRIYLRVHYASDVIAGFAAGLGWLLLSSWILSRIEKNRFARQALDERT